MGFVGKKSGWKLRWMTLSGLVDYRCEAVDYEGHDIFDDSLMTA